MIRAAVLVLLSCLLAVPDLQASAVLSPAETEALFEAARQRLTASEEESGPFRIRARLRFPFDPDAPEGFLLHAEAGPERRRTEWAFPGWRQVELRDGDLTWSWVGPDNDPRMAALSLQVRAMVDPGQFLRAPIAGPAKRHAGAGRELAELDLGIGPGRAHQVWIDIATAELVAAVRDGHRYDLGGERRAGGRSWPRSIRVSLEGEALLSASFGKPETGKSAVPESLFVPPEGAVPRAREGLRNLSPPVLLEEAEPHYPEQARREGFGGTVVVRAIIGLDGQVSEVSLLQGVREDLDRAALESVSRRVYSPGRLDGRPVEVISTIRISYTMKRSKPPSSGQRRKLQGEPR